MPVVYDAASTRNELKEENPWPIEGESAKNGRASE
jgi:hypothetical protein